MVQGEVKPRNPKVSILLATYNRAGLIGRAVESVRRQTFQDWELVIADDGSADKTAQVVEAWKEREPRIVYVRNPANQGISKNYNSGFKVMRGEYVAMIDDDDPWIREDKLAKQVEFLDEHPDYVGCGGGVIVVDGEGRERFRYLKPETDEAIRKRMLFGNPMANSTTLFRRAAGERAGWYDETSPYASDRDFWLKLGLLGKLYNFPEYFAHYTMAGHNTSIVRLRPHLRASLVYMRRYRRDYPGYPLALAFNYLQYLYSFLPAFIRRPIHAFLSRLKRATAG